MRFQLNFWTSHPLPPFLEGGGKSAPRGLREPKKAGPNRVKSADDSSSVNNWYDDHHQCWSSSHFDQIWWECKSSMLTFCEKSSGAILMKNLMKIWWKWIISDLCDIILQISVLADATPSRQNRRKHTNVGKSFKIIRLIWISTQYPQSDVLVVIDPSGLSLECLFANLCNCVKTAIFWLFC